MVKSPRDGVAAVNIPSGMVNSVACIPKEIPLVVATVKVPAALVIGVALFWNESVMAPILKIPASNANVPSSVNDWLFHVNVFVLFTVRLLMDGAAVNALFGIVLFPVPPKNRLEAEPAVIVPNCDVPFLTICEPVPWKVSVVFNMSSTPAVNVSEPFSVNA